MAPFNSECRDDSAPWKGYITELDGLRALAIAGVLATHFYPRDSPASFLKSIAAFGWMGVDLFFVISGFLIVGILIDSRSKKGCLKTFYARRTLRIAPLYYVYLFVVFVLIVYLIGGSSAYDSFVKESGSPGWYCFYLTNIKVAKEAGGTPPLLRILWSLAIEEQFYLVVPFLVIFIPQRYLLRVFIGFVLAAIVFRCMAYWVWPANHQLQYLLTPCRMDALALGGVVAIVLRTSTSIGVSRRLLATAGLIAALFLLALFTGMFDRRFMFCRTIGYTLIASFFAIIVLLVVRCRDSKYTSMLRSGSLCFIGRISYGIYVWHILAGTVVVKFFVSQGVVSGDNSILLAVAQSVVAVIVAAASWYSFERPILQLKRYVG